MSDVIGQREIFMANGTYEMCDVLVDQQQDRPLGERTMLCRSPRQLREFTARPMYGTWGEERSWMREFPEAVEKPS